MNKFYSILNSLSKGEVYDFELYLKSPFFRVAEDLIALGEVILMGREKGEPVLDKDVLWRAALPEKAYHPGTLRKHFSDLASVACDFVECIQHRGNKKGSIPLGLLREFDRRGVDSQFKRLQKKTRGAIEKDQSLSLGDMHKRHLFYAQSYNFLRTRQDPNQPNSDELMLLEMEEQSLLDYYHFSKLKLICAYFNRKRMGQAHPPIVVDESLRGFIEISTQSNILPHRLYALLFLVLEDEGPVSFEAFRLALMDYAGELSKEDSGLLLENAVNICVRLYAKGLSEFAEVLFGLYRDALKIDALIDFNGRLKPGHFKNICAVSNTLGKVDFTSTFIHEYEKRVLDYELQGDVVAWAKAHLAYSQRQYPRCLQILEEMQLRGNMKLEVRSLKMKALFEGGEIDRLESHMLSFEKWLQRALELNPEKRERQMARLRILKKIINMGPMEEDKSKKILAEIENKKPFDPEWLRKMIFYRPI